MSASMFESIRESIFASMFESMFAINIREIARASVLGFFSCGAVIEACARPRVQHNPCSECCKLKVDGEGNRGRTNRCDAGTYDQPRHCRRLNGDLQEQQERVPFLPLLGFSPLV